MSNNLLLLPTPRHVSRQDGVLSLSDHKLIALDGADPQALRFAASRLQEALEEHAGVSWGIVAGMGLPHAKIGATLSVVPESTRHQQGYELTITGKPYTPLRARPQGFFMR